MPVALNAATTGFNEGSTTFSHTPAGTDRLLVVLVVRGWPYNAVTSVTFNGINLTQIPGFERGDGGFIAVDAWYLVNPDATTANVVVTVASNTRLCCTAISFTGVHQTTPLGTAANNNGTGTSPTLNVSSDVDGMVVDCLGGVEGKILGGTGAGTGQTERSTVSVASGGNRRDQRTSTEAGTGGTVTMSWGIGTSDNWYIGAVPVKPASAGSSASAVLRLLLH